MVNQLIENGVDINAVNTNNNTALIVAISRGILSISGKKGFWKRSFDNNFVFYRVWQSSRATHSKGSQFRHCWREWIHSIDLGCAKRWNLFLTNIIMWTVNWAFTYETCTVTFIAHASFIHPSVSRTRENSSNAHWKRCECTCSGQRKRFSTASCCFEW